MQTNETTPKVENTERKERSDMIDYKMVTFSLAGKDYGVDIMNVKEIAKAGRFTFVPNGAPYLRGVYNLRGDIIPVIDLRIFFHLPAERREEDHLENMLILRLEDHVFGVIVDNIDKVVGIHAASIQPPHPIFGDINIKYIRGVVEKQDRLYIILDVVRIFAPKEEEKPRVLSESVSGAHLAPIDAPVRAEADHQGDAGGSELEFIGETLLALTRFTVSELNRPWVARRFEEWKRSRKPGDLQLKNADDAAEYLAPFYSPHTAAFWAEDYANALTEILPDLPSRIIQVWNPGCGKGYETFSLACILRNRYPEAQIKIWANDNDLLAISSAPNMVFDLEDVPEYCREYMVKGRNGYTFNPVIKDAVMFEFHDVKHANPFPELDIVLARDLLSFLPLDDQGRIFSDFSEKLKAKGLVILGRNEQIQGDDWKSIGKDPISAYIHNY